MCLNVFESFLAYFFMRKKENRTGASRHLSSHERSKKGPSHTKEKHKSSTGSEKLHKTRSCRFGKPLNLLETPTQTKTGVGVGVFFFSEGLS